MQHEQLQALLDPVLADVQERATVADRFIDKDHYQIYITTLWANLVLNPTDLNLQESDLEAVHDLLSGSMAPYMNVFVI